MKDSDQRRVHILFISVLLIILFPFFANAEDLKGLADKICHAYLEQPQDFAEVKMEKCE